MTKIEIEPYRNQPLLESSVCLMSPVEHLSRRSIIPVSSPEPAVIDPLYYPGWDSLLAAHPEGAFFHGAAWARVLNATYGHRPVYFGSVADGRLMGVLPVMELSSLLNRRRGVSLPFTDHCPVLGSEAVQGLHLLERGLRYGRERGWRSFECRSRVDGLQNAKPSLSFYSHRIDLTQGEASLWAGFKSRVRTPIRRAQEAKVEISFESGQEAIGAFYSLHCKTRRKHGLPPQPFSFFQNIRRYVLSNNNGWVAMARWRGTIVAAGVFFHLGRGAIHKFGASDPASQNLSANHLLLWEVMRRYSQQGFEFLDLGRTSVANEGLRQFKLGFGPKEEMLQYFRYDYRANAFVEDRDQVQGWFNHVFRRLPMPVLRLAGRMLYPQLS
jgi:hypothetical protein